MAVKPMKLLAVFVPPLLGVAAAVWTSLAFWYDMKEGLIAFMGFLAASLVQVMPITANFLQADRLTPAEASRLTTSLTKQQHYWIGMLFATIAAMVIVIVCAALNSRLANLPPLFRHAMFLEISWSAVACFVVATSVSFVLMKMLGLFEGMLALHRLRVELVLNNAKRDAAEKIAALQQEAEINAPLVPHDYGRIVQSH
jgi:hypothetical protein